MSTTLQRLRRRAINAKSKTDRAYWTRALLRNRAKRGVWDDRFLNGHPGNVSWAVKRFIMRGVAAGLVCTATTDGKHTETSYHYKRRAADMGVPGALVGTAKGLKLLVDFQLQEAKRPELYDELFGPVNDRCVKNTEQLTLTEGSPLETLHDNHVHGAPA